ncbi:SPOR domain-containing protein [Aurantiacibacter marinus]|uniref:SPOR domain-containing protein n=1 Tax=Aurantiacibacter marinus TaxID=874156 RepID=A0A0H0XVL2_9SPHN|nr:CDC27 family protein [Aurantiacibacter marinus]KLI64305.1 hypothetical protein AAV99_01310 [Aurantiacibacter marinus]
MNAMQKRKPTIGLGVTTAMAAVLLSGCASNPAPRAAASAAETQMAIVNGQHSQAIQAAEVAVAADPRNASYRMALGNAYLDAGRFASASASFQDAMALGDNSPRAALSLALALTGQARYTEAASLLNDWETEIAASDLGLALALSGQPDRGIHVLSNAIRSGENTVKSRQNLAYAYAVAGRWREARMMVAQDVPAHEVGDRMAEWAQMTHAEAYGTRVASLLGVPANVRDAGQPVHLALVSTPDAVQLASEASAQQPFAAPELAALDAGRMNIPATGGELPSVGTPAVGMAPPALPPVTVSTPRSSAPTNFAEAFTAEASARSAPAPATSRYETAPRVQQASPQGNFAPPAAVPRAIAAAAPSTATRAPASRRVAAANTPAIARPALDTGAAPSTGSSHLIQLGSFSSEAGATRAWGIYVSRYPELSDREMVITQAVVNGRNYWRVSAGGFDRAGSRAMCGRVDAASGEGCISWAANSPLPGAIDTGVRLARR